ncbi:GH1 family beta-glucosidase [Nocardioides massiliensis]|uniref:Beta-glucosidase n=1 Tax=Nocardioides massiliensis TaxID=1325935 RepID=A0ABT9NU24_9ACTN|nr:GH1 family beta-glucosidase [Nocardioides massiliensis]MDP9823918.1 beta-glucosidase [Nocardioides massiliensis]
MTDSLARLAGAFGPDFTWGVSTASYQIEGAVAEDGRTPSVWDTFCQRPGAVLGGDTGEVACDHYHRYAEDVALMAGLGVDAYRFSFAWPRIVPHGGRVEPRGLDFYDRLVDALLAAGIEPVPTLFHWDTPQWVDDLGGWWERSTADRFADYVAVVADRFADRISRWITLNEPAMVTMLGHGLGTHAPGEARGFDALTTAHVQLLAHGRAVQALRAAGVGSIGVANNHTPVWRADDSEAVREAAEIYDAVHNRLFADPLLLGTCPLGVIPDDDLAVIAQPLDWYGVNYYNPTLIGPPADDLPFSLLDIEGYARNDFGWPLVPAGLTELLVGMQERYGDALPPIMITENGGSFGEEPDASGRVPDQRRIDQLATHLVALRAAQDAGVDVRGYFHWSLLDNFEWAEGYRQRFGLVHVDYATQRRTPKDSYHWYRELIGTHR